MSPHLLAGGGSSQLQREREWVSFWRENTWKGTTRFRKKGSSAPRDAVDYWRTACKWKLCWPEREGRRGVRKSEDKNDVPSGWEGGERKLWLGGELCHCSVSSRRKGHFRRRLARKKGSGRRISFSVKGEGNQNGEGEGLSLTKKQQQRGRKIRQVLQGERCE